MIGKHIYKNYAMFFLTFIVINLYTMEPSQKELSQKHFSQEEIEMMKYIPIVLEQNRKRRASAGKTEDRQKKIILQPENIYDKGNERCKCHIL
jgi:hypothetical protein